MILRPMTFKKNAHRTILSIMTLSKIMYIPMTLRTMALIKIASKTTIFSITALKWHLS
jgi:hypothetical protein